MSCHVVTAESIQQLRRRYPVLWVAVVDREAVLVTSADGLRGLRPNRVTVVDIPRHMTAHELRHELLALRSVNPDLAVDGWEL